ncbi:hypothetical protein CNMCM8686_000188 [Aspergillus fumigatus]|nr:hypothetical protein CNMCM8686_000188 [Aspergillus fumigatus]
MHRDVGRVDLRRQPGIAFQRIAGGHFGRDAVGGRVAGQHLETLFARHLLDRLDRAVSALAADSARAGRARADCPGRCPAPSG